MGYNTEHTDVCSYVQMTVHLDHVCMFFMTSDFPVCMTLLVCLQTSGPQGSLKDGAKSSLQKSFRVLNEARMLENDVKGMCSIWHSGTSNTRKTLRDCYASSMKKPYQQKRSRIHYLI